MLLALYKKNGVISLDFIQSIKSLEDGRYLIRVDSLTERNTDSMRRKYRLMIDTISNHSGESPEEVHLRMKNSLGISTTAGESLSIEEWWRLIQQTKELAFTQLDLLL